MYRAHILRWARRQWWNGKKAIQWLTLGTYMVSIRCCFTPTRKMTMVTFYLGEFGLYDIFIIFSILMENTFLTYNY